MPKLSAGVLLHRIGDGGAVEVLLVHPGGPYWRRKDLGAWSIPKGEYGPDEEPRAAARREFAEELGQEVPPGEEHHLGERRQAGGKRVTVWAVRADLDVSAVVSNTFELEWPPGSGRRESFPEVDRAEWFGLDEARRRILAGQAGFLDDLEAHLR